MARFDSIIPKTLLPSTIATRRIVNEFTEHAGMVYFGYVSQRSDEHHIIRGLTVSNEHTDDHYCIGTYEDYDVVFVERTDSLKSGKKHVWHILEIDLKSHPDIPHMFIGSGKSSHGFHELLRTKYPTLGQLTLGATAAYPDSFGHHFAINARAGHQIDIERLITPLTAAAMADHFKGLAVEVNEQSLFIYSERSQVTLELLRTMLTNGVWLAKELDKNNRQPVTVTD